MPCFSGATRSFLMAAVIVGWALHRPADAQQSQLPACPKDRSIGWHNCYGTSIEFSGDKYFGEFRDDKPNGQGSAVWADGEQYIGGFMNGKRDGLGVSTWPDGDHFFGEFSNGSRSGNGTYTWSDGKTYIGEFHNGKRHGQGTYTYSDGAKYQGEWRNDKIHGKGVEYAPNGSVTYMGIWTEGVLVRQVDLSLPQPTANTLPPAVNAWHRVIKVAPNDVLNVRSQPSETSSIVGVLRPDQRQIRLLKNLGEWSLVQFQALSGYVATRFLAPDTQSDPPPTAATTPPPSAPKASSGSAFRIAKGQFVTNYHVIDGCNALKVDGHSGGRVIASDPINDLALVSIANDSGDIASIRTTRINLNETVTAAGFPLQGAFSGIAITNGSISRLSGLKGDTGQLQISAPVQPGNSGGPLLDAGGNVIGVVSGKLNALKLAGANGDIPQNINFAITGNALRAFLDAKSASYKEVGNEPERTGVQIAARATAFTVLVECR